MADDIVVALQKALGDSAVESGDAIGRRYWCDATGVAPHSPLALVRPRTTDEVASILRLCNDRHQPVIAQGGLTGLAGGATPRGGEIALSLERMTGIEEIDPAAATITVKAGTPLQIVQEAAADAGFMLGLDLGARGSAQIGGNISTNAGGIRVIRYGMTREQVLGLEVVLADGTILTSLNKMLKNNTAYDLKHLFIGSEGTLGVVTRAVLRLHPRPSDLLTALCALPSYEAVVAFLRHAQQALGQVSAFEAMWLDAYDFVASRREGAPPIASVHPFYVIIEHAGTDPDADAQAFEAMLAAAHERRLLIDVTVAQSEKQARAIWAIREGIAEWENIVGQIHLDVSLPIGAIGDFAERCRARLESEWPDLIATFYGHIGDSNLHVSLAPGTDDDATRHGAEAAVYDTVRDFNGSISAEHGIGTLKRDFLAYSRTPAELALMRTLKAALDPNNILNPGKVL
ncbi:MAG: FAD-binding oxidoreductase [Dongiaceae bacterium]